ncbi:UNVERIFIED_CONTAM: Mitoferrin [Sesamum calycinum]|uniref:Mitoferrin n=1 Tax=Sesamum calycinum TaxID=2727403 RepID=A0AAW2LYI4_9LAMI
MAGDSVCPRNEKISVKHKNDPFKGPVFELGDFDYTDITPSENDKCSCRHSDLQSSEMLSTTDLISAVGYAWNRAKKPLSVLLPKTNSNRETKVIPEGGVLHYSTDEGTFPASNLAYDRPCPVYLNSKANSGKVQENVENLKANWKTSWPQPCYENFPFQRIVLTKSTTTGWSSIENCLGSTGIPPNFRSVYGWMSDFALAKQKNQVNSVKIESKRTTNYFTCDCSTNSGSGCVPTDTTSTSSNITSGISTSNPETAQPLDSFREAANLDLKTATMTCSENDVVHGQYIEETDCKIFTSRCDADSQDTNIASSTNDLENSIEDSRNGLHEHHDQRMAFVQADPLKLKLACQERKNLYIHLQSKSMPLQEQWPEYLSAFVFIRWIQHVGALSRHFQQYFEFGPISLLYTLSHMNQSKKFDSTSSQGNEYHSLAHCTAGGCASIATSFIFTPSERIKQQMQVGSHYRNCWNALIQVVQKGGFPSLYAGWGAVLCRNVPHSVKFYTYESLKPIMSSSIQSNAQANTSVTLVCGGFAGSMASLFTTPFDVVKTRLQTQIPGSTTTYNGVFNTLKEIGKHEGLKGLYRGLTPRLVMYMVQGALFFASYESFSDCFRWMFHDLA